MLINYVTITPIVKGSGPIEKQTGKKNKIHFIQNGREIMDEAM